MKARKNKVAAITMATTITVTTMYPVQATVYSQELEKSKIETRINEENKEVGENKEEITNLENEKKEENIIIREDINENEREENQDNKEVEIKNSNESIEDENLSKVEEEEEKEREKVLEEIISGVEINENNFPDIIFRNYVLNNFDVNGDRILSEEEMNAVTSIDVFSMNVSSLTGIEYFKNLEELYCNDNKELISLDISQNIKLRELDCSNTQLTSLDVSENLELIILNCFNTQITSLDVSKNPNLRELACSDT